MWAALEGGGEVGELARVGVVWDAGAGVGLLIAGCLVL
ncbi:hypothetical protein EDD35_3950 [Amycolatopsis thermoflava]|uniref:Uncharacterized protein n=1 Tax=Amycolatopsis thermoflava TaxID=84480 RepID=A0A3N2GY34_9PSEU|nr:hypothetical protein EDD35_3950 [Amycolatopsis thermoflava]